MTQQQEEQQGQQQGQQGQQAGVNAVYNAPVVPALETLTEAEMQDGVQNLMTMIQAAGVNVGPITDPIERLGFENALLTLVRLPGVATAAAANANPNSGQGNNAGGNANAINDPQQQGAAAAEPSDPAE